MSSAVVRNQDHRRKREPKHDNQNEDDAATDHATAVSDVIESQRFSFVDDSTASRFTKATGKNTSTELNPVPSGMHSDADKVLQKKTSTTTASATDQQKIKQKGTRKRMVAVIGREGISKIRKLISSRDFSEALSEASTYLEAHPKNIEVMNLKVHCLRQLHPADSSVVSGSIEELTKCLEFDSRHPLTLFNLGCCHFELKEYSQAVKFYEAIASSSVDEKVAYNIAMCYEHIGDIMNAQSHYERSLQLNPRYSSAIVNYSNLLMRIGEIESARGVLEEYLRNSQQDQPIGDKVINNLNITLAEMRQDKKADLLFKRVISNNGNNNNARNKGENEYPHQHETFEPSLLYNQGVMFVKQNKLNHALDAFQRFTQLENVTEDDPLYILAHVNQGLVLEKMGLFEDAIGTYQGILDQLKEKVSNPSELENKISELKEKMLRQSQSNALAAADEQELQVQQSQQPQRPWTQQSWIPSRQSKTNNHNPFLQIRKHRFYESQQQQQQSKGLFDGLITGGSQQVMSSSDGMQLVAEAAQMRHLKNNFMANSSGIGNGSVRSSSRGMNLKNLERLSQPKPRLREDPNVRSLVIETSPRPGSSPWNSRSDSNPAVFERLSKQLPSKISDDGSSGGGVATPHVKEKKLIVRKQSLASAKVTKRQVKVVVTATAALSNNSDMFRVTSGSQNGSQGSVLGNASRVAQKKLYTTRQSSPVAVEELRKKSVDSVSSSFLASRYSLNGDTKKKRRNDSRGEEKKTTTPKQQIIKKQKVVIANPELQHKQSVDVVTSAGVQEAQFQVEEEMIQDDTEQEEQVKVQEISKEVESSDKLVIKSTEQQSETQSEQTPALVKEEQTMIAQQTEIGEVPISHQQEDEEKNKSHSQQDEQQVKTHAQQLVIKEEEQQAIEQLDSQQQDKGAPEQVYIIESTTQSLPQSAKEEASTAHVIVEVPLVNVEQQSQVIKQDELSQLPKQEVSNQVVEGVLIAPSEEQQQLAEQQHVTVLPTEQVVVPQPSLEVDGDIQPDEKQEVEQIPISQSSNHQLAPSVQDNSLLVQETQNQETKELNEDKKIIVPIEVEVEKGQPIELVTQENQIEEGKASVILPSQPAVLENVPAINFQTEKLNESEPLKQEQDGQQIMFNQIESVSQPLVVPPNDQISDSKPVQVQQNVESENVEKQEMTQIVTAGVAGEIQQQQQEEKSSNQEQLHIQNEEQITEEQEPFESAAITIVNNANNIDPLAGEKGLSEAADLTHSDLPNQQNLDLQPVSVNAIDKGIDQPAPLEIKQQTTTPANPPEESKVLSSTEINPIPQVQVVEEEKNENLQNEVQQEVVEERERSVQEPVQDQQSGVIGSLVGQQEVVTESIPAITEVNSADKNQETTVQQQEKEEVQQLADIEVQEEQKPPTAEFEQQLEETQQLTDAIVVEGSKQPEGLNEGEVLGSEQCEQENRIPEVVASEQVIQQTDEKQVEEQIEKQEDEQCADLVEEKPQEQLEETVVEQIELPKEAEDKEIAEQVVVDEEVTPSGANVEVQPPSAAIVEQAQQQQKPEVFAETPKEQDVPFKLPADFATWTRSHCEHMIANSDELSYLAHYKLGLLDIEASEFLSGKEQLLIVAEMQPEFMAAQIQLAIAEIHANLNEWKNALHYYHHYLKKTDDKFDGLMRIGRCHKKLDSIDHAIKSYQEAIETQVEDRTRIVKAYYKLAKIRLNAGEDQNAMEYLVKALVICPNEIKLLLKLGQIFLEMDVSQKERRAGQSQHALEREVLDESLKYLLRALVLDKNKYETLICLGKLYDKRSELDYAIRFTELAVAHEDHNVNAVYYLGTLYLKERNLEKSARCFQIVLEGDSEHIPSLIEYATVLGLSGEYDKSKKFFKLALKLSPNNLICNMRLGRVYQLKFNDFDRAIECYKRVIAVEPSYSKAHYQMGVIHAARKEFKDAVDSFNQCLKVNPKNPDAWREIGSVFQETGNPEKALKYYTKAQSLFAGGDATVETGIANCHYFLEEYDVAIQKFQDILNKKKALSAGGSVESSTATNSSTATAASTTAASEDEILHNLGDCYFMKDDMDNAIIYYEKALVFKADKPDCLYNLGNAFCMKGRYQEALEVFLKCVEFDDENASALYNLGNVYYILSDEGSAWRCFEMAVEREPDNTDWRNYIASTYFEAGEYNEALRHLLVAFHGQGGQEDLQQEKKHKNKSKDVDMCLRIAETLLMMEREQEAKRYLKICLELDPSNQEALRMQEYGVSDEVIEKRRNSRTISKNSSMNDVKSEDKDTDSIRERHVRKSVQQMMRRVSSTLQKRGSMLSQSKEKKRFSKRDSQRNENGTDGAGLGVKAVVEGK